MSTLFKSHNSILYPFYEAFLENELGFQVRVINVVEYFQQISRPSGGFKVGEVIQHRVTYWSDEHPKVDYWIDGSIEDFVMKRVLDLLVERYKA